MYTSGQTIRFGSVQMSPSRWLPAMAPNAALLVTRMTVLRGLVSAGTDRVDQTAVRVGETSLTPGRPRAHRLRREPSQPAPSSWEDTSRPRTSRPPSLGEAVELCQTYAVGRREVRAEDDLAHQVAP
jgi:hypothetical protein